MNWLSELQLGLDVMQTDFRRYHQTLTPPPVSRSASPSFSLKLARGWSDGLEWFTRILLHERELPASGQSEVVADLVDDLIDLRRP